VMEQGEPKNGYMTSKNKHLIVGWLFATHLFLSDKSTRSKGRSKIF